jgi:hypothetical protein
MPVAFKARESIPVDFTFTESSAGMLLLPELLQAYNNKE